jgi:hypothetical protein
MPSLPNELVSQILEYSDYKTITACRRLCRCLKDIVDTTVSLRYIVELGAAGMCDGPPDSVGLSERLRKLEGSRTAWKSSVWSQPDGFPDSKEIFPSPIARSGNLVMLKGPYFGSGKYLLLRLPSEARGIPERVWHLHLDCEHMIQNICLDDSPCFLELTTYLRSDTLLRVHSSPIKHPWPN